MPATKARAGGNSTRVKRHSKRHEKGPPRLSTAETPPLTAEQMGRKSLWPAAISSVHYMFLCAVVRLGENAYEAAIRRWFSEQLGEDINPGHISLAGQTLVDTYALLTVDKQPNPDQPKGKKVKVYRITRKGIIIMRALGKLRTDLQLST